MKRRGLVSVAAVVMTVVALGLAGCTAQTSKTDPAQLGAHVAANTILPVTAGTGTRSFPIVRIGRPGSHVGIETSCVGTGTVTVTLPSGGYALIANCADTGGRQTASVEYPSVPAGSGPIKVVSSSGSARWDTTVFYTN